MAAPILLLASTPDVASVNLRDTLLDLVDWSPMAPTFEGRPLRRHDHFVLAESDTLHLELDGLGDRVRAALGGEPEAVLVLSKHKAQSGQPSLTVHPVGNWGAEARHGGAPRVVCPTHPRLMAAILQGYAAHKPKGFQATYEITHHGPEVDVPLAFVEVGSTEEQWSDPAPAAAVARAVLEAPERAAALADVPVLLGVGGGHYAPRFTDLARNGVACFGHLLPDYALEAVDAATLRAAATGMNGFFVDDRRDPPALATVRRELEKVLPEVRDPSERAE